MLREQLGHRHVPKNCHSSYLGHGAGVLHCSVALFREHSGDKVEQLP
jgi:hypothetical protein